MIETFKNFRILFCSAAMLVASASAYAQDTITAGAVRAAAGSATTIPLSIRDANGAPLSVNRGDAARIQAIAFKVTASPAGSVTAILFERAGVLQSLTPLYERTVEGAESLGYVGSFASATNPIPFGLNAALPGNRIGTLFVDVAPGLADGTEIDLKFDVQLTVLANQTGTIIESVYNHKLKLADGAIVVGGIATATTLSSSPNPSAAGNDVTFTASVSPALTGTVAFRNRTELLGIATLTGGTATLTTSALPQGTHTIRAYYEGAGEYQGSEAAPLMHTVSGPPIAPPAAVTATATSTTSVQVSWPEVAGAASYEIARSSANSPFTVAGTSATTNFTDTGRTPGVTYLYVVRSVASGGGKSLDSVKDAATTIMFTDDPLHAGVTKVKRVHLTELRTAVNAYRASAGLTAAVFTDAVPGTVKGVHIEELRTALQAARAAYGLSALTFTDASLAGVKIKAVHLSQLRGPVK